MKWMDEVRRCKSISASERLVILHIGATATPEGRDAWRANGTVAGELGVSHSTVKRARKAAVERGLLVVTKDAPRGAGNNHTTEYRLNIAKTNRVASDPVSSEQIGSAQKEIGSSENTNRVKMPPEIGSGEVTPSVSSSVISSVSSSVGNRLDPKGQKIDAKKEVESDLLDTICPKHEVPLVFCDSECTGIRSKTLTNPDLEDEKIPF
jgi:hypothetical protein